MNRNRHPLNDDYDNGTVGAWVGIVLIAALSVLLYLSWQGKL